MRNYYKILWKGPTDKPEIQFGVTVRATAFSLARVMGDKYFAENARFSIDEVETIIITKVKNESAAACQ